MNTMNKKFKAALIQKLKPSDSDNLYMSTSTQHLALFKDETYIELDEQEIFELKNLLNSFEQKPYYQ